MYVSSKKVPPICIQEVVNSDDSSNSAVELRSLAFHAIGGTPSASITAPGLRNREKGFWNTCKDLFSFGSDAHRASDLREAIYGNNSEPVGQEEASENPSALTLWQRFRNFSETNSVPVAFLLFIILRLTFVLFVIK